jgi:hypothetical protein
MVVGSLLLLYRGVIQLEAKVQGTALEAEFKDQLRVNIRNPALGLFAIGFAFFALALFEAHPQDFHPGDLVQLEGNVTLVGADTVGSAISARVYGGDWPVPLPSNGRFVVSVRPVERLFLEVKAPGYQPSLWTATIDPEQVKEGRIELNIPTLKPASGIPLVEQVRSPPDLSRFGNKSVGELFKP